MAGSGQLERRWLPNTGDARHNPTIEVLPEDVLLEIFDFDRLLPVERSWEYPWQWHRLVHVCQRWRRVVFSSPRRLDLRLFCSNGTPVKETLAFWPALPIVMRYGGFPGSKPASPEDEENVMTALHHPDRIYEIGLTIEGSLGDRLATEMQRTMPSLVSLRLMVQNKAELLLSDEFLGGSAPLLSVISLHGVGFPALPKLLLSSSNLVSLELWNIPRSGYFSPEALVVGLSAMTQLKSFKIHFDFPIFHFHASNLRTPPSGRIVLPALTNFKFWGVSEYLEDIVARIDTPLLELIDLRFFNRLIFEIPHLSHFVRRTSQLGSPTQAKIYSSGSTVSLTLINQPGTLHTTIPGQLRLQIMCRQFDWQLSAISQISTQLSPFLSGVGQLDVRTFPPSAGGHDNSDTARWIELLRPFDGVERLRVADELVLDIARALQRVTSEPDNPELFPALRELCFLGNSREFPDALETIAPYISARQLSERPVVVYNWDTNTFD